MSGIFGIVRQDPRQSLISLLRNMAASMTQDSSHSADFYVSPDGTFGIGTVHPTGFSALSMATDGDSIAVLHGEILDVQLTSKELADITCNVSCESRSAAILLHGYERFGQKFLSRVNGVFTAAMWNSRERQLIITNDWLGLKPLYYATLPDQFLFASEIKALLREPRLPQALNPRGIAQFLTFGHLLSDDTLFQSIHALQCAAWLTYHKYDGLGVHYVILMSRHLGDSTVVG